MYDGEQYTKIGVPFDTTRFSDEERGMPNQTIKTFEKNNKNYCIFCFLNILYVTELPEVVLALGTKLRLVLSFFCQGEILWISLSKR